MDWILRTDASELGVGAALFQIYKAEGEEPIYQPISFASKKFSDATEAQESKDKVARRQTYIGTEDKRTNEDSRRSRRN